MAETAAEVYERFFLPALFEQWADKVARAADVSDGADVLDIGCGTGVLARRALELVGPKGRVVGVDPNKGMLAVARRTVDVEWVSGMAESLPLPDDSFDAVVSQFAIMFFEDPSTALGEMSRVLRPGGRVAIASWASLEDTPGYAAMVELLDRLFGPEAGDALRAPYKMADAGAMRALLVEHLDDVEVSQVEGTARFESIDAWVHTDIRGWTLSDMSEGDLEVLLDAARVDLAPFTDADGKVTFAAPALIAVGTARP